MPYCAECGRYGPTADFRRVRRVHEPEYLAYICRKEDRPACKALKKANKQKETA